MKANSCGLEVDVEVNNEELLKLKTNKLEGILKYWDREENKREIPITISNLDKEQREFVEVSQEPSDIYFGLAERINFSINEEFYEILNKTSSY